MLMNAFWLGHVDGAGTHLLELINQPSLNINGLSSGQTGARAANVIPPTATADLDLRLVVGIDWRAQQQRVVDYIPLPRLLRRGPRTHAADPPGASASCDGCAR